MDYDSSGTKGRVLDWTSMHNRQERNNTHESIYHSCKGEMETLWTKQSDMRNGGYHERGMSIYISRMKTPEIKEQ